MMKKFKIVLGSNNGKTKTTPIINAHDKREAVIKYLQSIDEETTEERIESLIGDTYEHVPKPRTGTTKPLEQADIGRLDEICEHVLAIEEGLLYGSIAFKYDNLMCALKPGHPMEILDGLLAKIYFTVQEGEEPTMEEMEETVKSFKEFKEAFGVKELSKPIKELADYIAARKLSREAK